MKVRGERIHFHGLDRSDYFFLSDTIIRIEAAHGGKHSILITSEVEVRATVAELDKRYGRIFLRCHQSYLVDMLCNVNGEGGRISGFVTLNEKDCAKIYHAMV